MITRRGFLTFGFMSLISTGLPAFSFATPESKNSNIGKVLLTIHLAGGNDALNTVIPYRSTAYYQARPSIHIPSDSVCRLDDRYGLHPALKSFVPLFEQGRLSVVNGVGYVDALKSHVLAAETWQTSLSDLIKSAATSAVRSENENSPASFRDELHRFEKLLSSHKIEHPVYQISLDGFDTHRNQLARHEELLSVLSSGLVSLFRRLETRGLSDRVLILVYSEFGRSVAENEDHGTDHGNAGTCFLIGGNAKGGIYGAHEFSPSSNDLKKIVDIDQVSATIAHHWFEDRDNTWLGVEPLRGLLSA
ncbi:MAG: DUF1501 domain-containing protein [Cyanobacteria bacterium]|nr:DUF1501 domain-containing protein [Cyanobacteriota bacterium]